MSVSSSSSRSPLNFLTSPHSSSPPIPPVVSISGHPTLCTYTPFWHPHFSSASFLGASLAPTVLCKSSAPRSTSLVSSFLLEQYRHGEKHAIGSSASSVYTPRDRSCSELGRQAEKYGGEGRSVKSLLEREIVNGLDVLYLPDLFEGERLSVINDQREREKRRRRREREEDSLEEREDEDEDFFCTCRREEEEEVEEMNQDKDDEEDDDDGDGDEETVGDSEVEERRRRRRGLLLRERNHQVDEEMCYTSQRETSMYRKREAERRRERERREFLVSSSYERRDKHPLGVEDDDDDACSSLSSSSSSSSSYSDSDDSFFSSTLLGDDQKDETLDKNLSPSLRLHSSSPSPANSFCTSPYHPNSSALSQQHRQEVDSSFSSSSFSSSFSSSSSLRSPSHHHQERGCEVYVQRLPLDHPRVSVPVLVSPVGPQHDALQFLALRYHVNPEEKEEREEIYHDETLPSESTKNLSHLSIHSTSSPFSTVECRLQPQPILQFRPRAFWSSDEDEEKDEERRYPSSSSCRFSSSSIIRESDEVEKEDEEKDKEEEEEERNEERSSAGERERRRRRTEGGVSHERDKTDHISHRHPPLSPPPSSSFHCNPSSSSSSSSFLSFHQSLTRHCRHLRFSSSSSPLFFSSQSPSLSPTSLHASVQSAKKKKHKGFRQARKESQIRKREEKFFPGTLRLLEVKVDDKHFEKKWIFTRNRRGFSIGLLRLSEEIEEGENEDTCGGRKRRREFACSSSAFSSSVVLQRLLYEHLVDGRYSNTSGARRGAKTKKIVERNEREDKRRIRRYLSHEEASRSSSSSVYSPQEKGSFYCSQCGRPFSPSSSSPPVCPFSSSYPLCRWWGEGGDEKMSGEERETGGLGIGDEGDFIVNAAWSCREIGELALLSANQTLKIWRHERPYQVNVITHPSLRHSACLSSFIHRFTQSSFSAASCSYIT